MGKSQPDAPAAPDYAAANEAGVKADIDALPLRNAINAATTLGTSYTDPNTGKNYDFSGLGSSDIANAQLKQQLAAAPEIDKTLLGLQQQYGPQFAAAARASLQATDPTGFAMRDAFAGDLNSGKNSASNIVNAFNPDEYLKANPDLQSMVQGMSPDQANAALQAHWNDHGQAEGRIGGSTGITAPQYEQAAGNGPELSRLSANAPTLDRMGSGPAMDRVGDADSMGQVGNINLSDTGAAQAGRSTLESQIFDQLSQTGQIDPVLQRQYEQSSRARGAANGNVSGSAGALDESMAVQQAQAGLDTDRRNAALNLLQSGQTTSDKANALSQQQQQSDIASTGFNNQAKQANYDNSGKTASFNNNAAQQEYDNSGKQTTFNNATAQQGFQNQAAMNDSNNQVANQSFQNAMAAIGQRNQALQNSFASQEQVQQTKLAANQQDTANKQSFLGLAPIVSQGAQLAGLQQGAAPTTSGTGYNAVGTAQNAGQLGSGFAGNIFGTQANIFSTQSSAATAANGQMAGLATSFLCHVARLVYGETNGKWVVFYHWKEYAAPKWFKRLYNRYSVQAANVIRYSQTAYLVRLWMDSRIQLSPA